MINKKLIRLGQIIFIGLLFMQMVSCKKNNDNNIPDPSPTIITDIDGNIYHTVNIGNQVWMVENLSTTRYNDGTPIPLVYDPYTWYYLTTPGYCFYVYDTTAHQDIYGALYNWYAVNTGKLAPKGWHIPTFDEWTTLITYLGGDSIAGAKLKEKDTTHWFPPNSSANNESGFTALPGGVNAQIIFSMGYYGYWWSSSKNSFGNPQAWYWCMSYDNAQTYRNLGPMYYGYSVRCIRN